MVRNLAPKSVNVPTLLRYAIAFFATMGAEAMALLTVSYMPQSPFILFVFAVVVSAWFGGRGPGLLATFLGTFATGYIFFLPIIPRSATGLDNLLWLLMSVLLALLTNSLITLRQQGQDALLRLAAIVESSDDAIIGQDLKGIINSWNPGAEKVYGYSADQVKDHPASFLVPTEQAVLMAENLEKVGKGEHLRFEAEHVRKDGRRIAVSCALSPLTSARGTVVGASMIARDITAAKRAQAERDKLLVSEQAARAEAESTARHLAAVQTITDATLTHLCLDDLLRELLSRIRSVLGADTAMILLLEEDRKQVAIRASVGLDASETVQIPIESGITDRIVAMDQPSVEDLSTAGSGWPLLHQNGGSLLSAPLRIEGRVIGVAQVATNRPRRFEGADVELLQVAADRAALAIDRARLFDQASAAVDRLKMLSQKLMDAQEAERRSIARELHDEIGQALTAVKINLQVALRTLDSHAVPEPTSRQETLEAVGTDQPRLPGQINAATLEIPLLEESITLTERILQQVRSLSLDLHPSVLDDLGLVAALRWYVDRTAQRAGFAAQFANELSDGRPTPEIEIACFRVVQEALTNIVRHAQARRVRVNIRECDGSYELVVGDDGVGFDARTARSRAVQGKSSGLLGMEERVLAVGGRIEIQSRPGHGTEICARFPRTSA